MPDAIKIGLEFQVTSANYKQVLHGIKCLFEPAAAAPVAEPEPANDAAKQPLNGEEAPKAGRRKNKAADAAPPAEEPAAPVEEPQPDVVEPTASEVWEDQPAPEPEPEPAPAPAAEPLTLEGMKDKLNAFAKIHGIAATRKNIHAFGVTHLTELDPTRWPELVAKLQAENGGKAV
jgi:hypothetical protein